MRNVCLSFIFIFLACKVSGQILLKLQWNITLVADLDKGSKVSDKAECQSFVKTGTLTIDALFREAEVKWGPDMRRSVGCRQGSRGLELSDLIFFNKDFYSCDDKTGIVYKFSKNLSSLEKFVTLTDGDGSGDEGFKCEWMTIKDDQIYVGSHGRERTNDDGSVKHRNFEWIKIIAKNGHVTHKNWHYNYDKLRQEANYKFPGYLIHEAVQYDEKNKFWYFMPRKASRIAYDPDLEEYQGSNLFFKANLESGQIQVITLGPLDLKRGTASFKMIQHGTKAAFVVLKTMEVKSQTASFLGVYSEGRKVIMKDTLVSLHKYEGIEVTNKKIIMPPQRAKRNSPSKTFRLFVGDFQ